MYAKKHLLLTIIAFILFFAIGWKGAEYYYFTNYTQTIGTENDGTTTTTPTPNCTNPQSVDLSLYWDVWDEIEANYINEADVKDDENLVYGSIAGLVDSLGDPYTLFMTPTETKQFEETLNGSLEGIGAELTVEDGLLIVVSPLKDSPAEKAGLLPGDIIFQIDGEIANEMSLFDAIMNIRGERGTEVTLTIIRDGVDEAFDVTIVREEIDLDSISYEMLEDDIFYVSVNQFSDNTSEEFDKAVQAILLNNPKGIILDLRYNGGGYLDIAVDLVSEFVEGSKPVVQLKTRYEENNEVYYVDGDARLADIPLVVLVNQGSASASEIVAGAIQDHERGLVIGENTFGKGSVQEVAFFEDGSSLRLTIAKWLTPSGRDIDEVGIEPNRIVEYTFEDFEADNDTQLNEAISYLKNL
jgi:carboxyl-terminal processing protease